MESSCEPFASTPKDGSAEIIIDGNQFSDFLGFVVEFSRSYCTTFGGPSWNGDFNDLDEMLEAPGKEFLIFWINSENSKSELNHAAMETVRRKQLKVCEEKFPHVPTMLQGYREQIDAAVAKSGPTLFEHLCGELSYDGCSSLRLK